MTNSDWQLGFAGTRPIARNDHHLGEAVLVHVTYAANRRISKQIVRICSEDVDPGGDYPLPEPCRQTGAIRLLNSRTLVYEQFHLSNSRIN